MTWKGVLIRNLKVRVVMNTWKCTAVRNLVVEWKEAVTVERIGCWKPRVHRIGICGTKKVRIPILSGIERVLRRVQVIR